MFDFFCRLRGGKLDAESVEQIESSLEEGGSITEAGFSNCESSVELMEAIVRALRRNKLITSL